MNLIVGEVMHIPSHLEHFSSQHFRQDYTEAIKGEFSGALQKVRLNFEDFEKQLNKLEKAVFFKIGFIFHNYIKDLECKKCEHQTTQLRFLACIAAIESLLGNSKRETRKIKI